MTSPSLMSEPSDAPPSRALAYFVKLGSPLKMEVDPLLVRIVCGVLAVLLVPVVGLFLFHSENGLLTGHHPPTGRVPGAIGACAALALLAVAAWRGVQRRTAATMLWLAIGVQWMLERDPLLGLGGRLLGVAFLLQAWTMWTDRPRSTTGRAVLGVGILACSLGGGVALLRLFTGL